MPLKVIIAGAPASGKGTQCEMIKEKYGVVHLSTGDMLRAAVKNKSPVGNIAKSYMDAGQLVPDKVIIDVVKDRLSENDCKEKGWLLDGFPRTGAQGTSMKKSGIVADSFIFLNVPDNLLIDRVVGRRTDPVTGKIYHMTFSPPENALVAERLVQRSDDTEEKVKVRLKAYHANIGAVQGHFKEISVEVNGDGKPANIFKGIEASLDKKLPGGSEHVEEESAGHDYLKDGYVITVVGASGDLAKKKTYPSLLNLFANDLVPNDTVFWGFARSNMSHDDLRTRLRPFLIKMKYTEEVVDSFLSKCFYQAGTGYGDQAAWKSLSMKIQQYEELTGRDTHNRLFYFAIPPKVFAETGIAIKKYAMAPMGWSRMIVEKPFGRDLASCEQLLETLSANFKEEELYRIDHYLGKELCQNLLVLRFGNIWLENIMNKDHVQCVICTFKEPFGTDGRGGYFDSIGVIRDIIQNHLMQVMTMLTMEAPTKVDGPIAGDRVRDSKVNVLESIPPITIDDVYIGQYEGYTDDPTVTNKNSNCATFAMIRLFVHNPKWDGVPFIFKAGKALNERKAEMRVQFKSAPGSEFMFDDVCPRNELVMRMQPNEAIYLKTNIKTPGFSSKPVQLELETNYDANFYMRTGAKNPDAYTRLILDVIRGRNAWFVRDDELRRCWEVFTPILHKLEQDESIRPKMYKYGSRGPSDADAWLEAKSGYRRNTDYVFNQSSGKIESKDKTAAAPKSVPVSEGVGMGQFEGLAEVGLYGLAVMGQNFALNMASHGFKVCVGNRSPAKVDLTVNRAVAEGKLPLIGSKDAKDFISKLSKPRKVIILVMAGKPVDDTIATLSQHMEEGDVIVDGGNEWFPNTIRRGKDLEAKGIHFIGMGISGGEEGARNGPSLMPGGPRSAYDSIEPIIMKCAAQVNDGACTGYVGPIGSGNYVKMVHNGIEYGDMQLICEVYDIMKNIGGMSNHEMADVFKAWNKTELDSYLIEITGLILAKNDKLTGKGQVVDYILDKTGMKGTGRWTVQEAAENSVAAPTIAASYDARCISARKEERVEAAEVLKGWTSSMPVNKESLIEDLKAALYASKVCSYAQGLGIIKAASDAHGWNVDLPMCAKLWKGGCIIRAGLLQGIQDAMGNPDLPNLMLDPKFAAELNERSEGWRRIIRIAMLNGIACPSMTCALTYFDSYRRENLPANLTQAQRDFFGGHTYARTDMPGVHHTAWTDAHKDIGDISQRAAGEN